MKLLPERIGLGVAAVGSFYAAADLGLQVSKDVSEGNFLSGAFKAALVVGAAVGSAVAGYNAYKPLSNNSLERIFFAEDQTGNDSAPKREL